MAKNTKKVVKELDEAQKKLENTRKREQRRCDHQRKPGDPDLSIIENKGGKTAYRCEKCKKIIDQQPPNDVEMDEAFARFDTASDYMRLMTNSSTENGAASCEWYSDFIMKAEKFVKAYKSMRNDAQKKKEKRNKKSGSHGGAYYEG